MLDDSLLYFLKPVVVIVENLTHILYVEVVLAALSPWQTCKQLKIVELHMIVGTLRVDAFKFHYFPLEYLCDFCTPFFLLCFVSQLVAVLLLDVETEFFLNVLHLLVQEVLLLLLVNLLMSFLVNHMLQFYELSLLVQKSQQMICSVLDRLLVQ